MSHVDVEAQVADVDHARPVGDEEGIDTGADAGERAAAVARLEGFTKADWRALRLQAAEGTIEEVYVEAVIRRTHLQYPGAAKKVTDEYSAPGRWSKPQIVKALVHGHGASGMTLQGWERWGKPVLVQRVVIADLCGIAEATAVEESTGRLWTPSAADVARHGGR